VRDLAGQDFTGRRFFYDETTDLKNGGYCRGKPDPLREIGLNRVSGAGLLGEVLARLQREVVCQDVFSGIFEPDVDGEITTSGRRQIGHVLRHAAII